MRLNNYIEIKKHMYVTAIDMEENPYQPIEEPKAHNLIIFNDDDDEDDR